MTLKVGTRYCG